MKKYIIRFVRVLLGDNVEVNETNDLLRVPLVSLRNLAFSQIARGFAVRSHIIRDNVLCMVVQQESSNTYLLLLTIKREAPHL